MEILPQFLTVLVFVFLNGFFVASEFSLVGVRKTRIAQLARRGSKAAKLVKSSLDHLDTYISSTQLGITLASLALGWIGEPAIAHFLEPILSRVLPEQASIISAHTVAIALAFSTITLLHVVLGELAPKTIALQKAESVSLVIIGPLILFTRLLQPIIWVLNGAGNIVLRLVGFRAPAGHLLVHSEEEIKMILAQSAKEGAIEKEEAEMVYSVFRFGDTQVKKIMIPIKKAISFELDTPILRVIALTQKHPHSRFPVYENSIHNIVGFVHIKDVYRKLVSLGSTSSIRSSNIYFQNNIDHVTLRQLKAVRNIPHVSDTKRIDDVLIDMKKKQVHIAIVQTNKKKTAGIVTMEDVVETLTGAIHDEFEDLRLKTH